MDTIVIVAAPLAAMGFIFGMAFAQVNGLKEEVQGLRSQLEVALEKQRPVFYDDTGQGAERIVSESA